MLTITTRLNDVQTTLDLLKLHGREQPNVKPHDAIQLVRDFGSKSFWTRPFFPELVFQDGWIEATPPIENGMVLDPQLILASYIRSINMWLCTLALMEPNGTPDELRLDLSDIEENLKSLHRKLVNGIRTGIPPQLIQIVEFPDPTPDVARPGGWTLAKQHIAAVDIFANNSLVSQFAPQPRNIGEERDEADKPEMEDIYPRFVVRFRVGSNAKRKALYILNGYAD